MTSRNGISSLFPVFSAYFSRFSSRFVGECRSQERVVRGEAHRPIAATISCLFRAS